MQFSRKGVITASFGIEQGRLKSLPHRTEWSRMVLFFKLTTPTHCAKIDSDEYRKRVT